MAEPRPSAPPSASHGSEASLRDVARGRPERNDAVGNDVAGEDTAGQTRGSYDMVDQALRAVGLHWSDAARISAFTTRMDDDLAPEQAITCEYFGDGPPTSTLVAVSIVPVIGPL